MDKSTKMSPRVHRACHGSCWSAARAVGRGDPQGPWGGAHLPDRPVGLIARSEINGVVDGFVYGAMVGLGFAVVENVFYFVGQFGGQPDGVLGGFFVRVLAAGLYGHVLYSGLTCMGIAWFVTRTDQRPARRLGVAAGLCLAAVLAHFLWNSPLLNLFPTGDLTVAEALMAIPLAAAVKGVPFLVLVVLLVGLARRQERRW